MEGGGGVALSRRSVRIECMVRIECIDVLGVVFAFRNKIGVPSSGPDKSVFFHEDGGREWGSTLCQRMFVQKLVLAKYENHNMDESRCRGDEVMRQRNNGGFILLGMTTHVTMVFTAYKLHCPGRTSPTKTGYVVVRLKKSGAQKLGSRQNMGGCTFLRIVVSKRTAK